MTLITSLALLLSSALPATAGAYATPEAPPLYSSAPGLPDGRVYEQVSPADKNGNEAGATTQQQATGAQQRYGFAAADGNSVLFEGSGAMGESPWGASLDFVASKNQGSAGWSTHAALPAAQQSLGKLGGLLHVKKREIVPSPDLSHVMFVSESGTFAGPSEPAECRIQPYLAGPDPFVPAVWLAEPELPNPSVTCPGGTPVGGSPDFSTVYFTSSSPLLPEDAPRTQNILTGTVEEERHDPSGFYEYSEGALREAAILPDEKLDPFGAVPAASEREDLEDNPVSADGSRAFFVSPDPVTCTYNGGQNDCAADPPELYVRETAGEGSESHHETLLVSRDTLLPQDGGLPAPAPAGVLGSNRSSSKEFRFAYVIASPDGSQAFFQSDDALTGPAQAASPGTEPKTYDFDVDTGALTYLPNVAGEFVATDTDGSALAFVRPEAGAEPAELELWSAGPVGGSVTPVTRLPGAGGAASELRFSDDGSVLVFETSAQLSAAFNSDGGAQIYRYDASTNTLGCVSCPPHGVTLPGEPYISTLQQDESVSQGVGGRFAIIFGRVDVRGISANGDRVFFDTTASLVAQDSNTDAPAVEVAEGEFEAQGGDVYEWENGVVYLISGGKATRNSILLDSSANGDDVFFATTESLVPGDTDGGYDVYDARVPHPGDNPPAAAVPCEGSVCQGPPNVPAPLTPPASATFSGLGNPAPEVTPPPPPAKTTTKTVKCKKGLVKKKKKNKCVKKPKAKKSAKRSK